ncbi:HET-domain-containing protein [Coniochaeta ligniaria NRRL 30616]|uniref:HET-domain-containing protein n=1 Tax=Coniochaeta ligniaria NRRL 30616 TaxID=1408157 RepID=A0A1J7IG47_9PEZI|nr:HET-domain-containing protein [Coniochaeta ligniaria NRRL 30616]
MLNGSTQDTCFQTCAASCLIYAQPGFKRPPLKCFPTFHTTPSSLPYRPSTMRLIKTSTLEMKEFMGDYESRYAILSHTWEKDEITFQEMLQTYDTNDIRKANAIKSKAGYLKIRKAAEVATSMAFEYIWIDTCCIDKSSSAELSEAINSMFRWYKKATVCIAYIADIGAHEVVIDLDGFMIGFMDSKWFTRGWTLQELLAPVNLRFYLKDWKYFEDKSRITEELSHITGIDREVLLTGDVSSTCVAGRMSWASGRVTTRIEDMAYCLLGLFDVNMPLLYGEGDKAFQRLQEEIIKKSDDHTLFAWTQMLTVDEKEEAFALHRGLFARSSREFASFSRYSAANIANRSLTQNFTHPSTITNIGLQTRLQLIPVRHAGDLCIEPPVDTADPENEYLALLNYRDVEQRQGYRYLGRYAIQLKKLIATQSVYVRVRPDITYSMEEEDWNINTTVTDLIIQQSPRIYQPHVSSRLAGFYITLEGPAFKSPFTTTMCTGKRREKSVVDTSKPLDFLPLFRGRGRPKVSGTVIRNAENGLSTGIAFGLNDSADAEPIVCIYQIPQADDAPSIRIAETKRKALSHGMSNVISQPWQQVTTSVRSGHWPFFYESYSVVASTAVRDDKLVCCIKINGWFYDSEVGISPPSSPD